MSDVLKHALFVEVPEANHRLSKIGQGLCKRNADLCPGHNCCACCAEEPSGLLLCDNCERVSYCGEAHMNRDGPHSVVCGLLSALEAAENIEVPHEQAEQILAGFNLTTQVLGSASGWADVLPAQYAPPQLPKEDKPLVEGDAQDETNRPAKRQRMEPIEPSSSSGPEEEAANSDESSEEAEEEVESEEQESEEEEEEEDVDPEVRASRLLAAVQVAVATSYLTYPATLASALVGSGSMASVAAGVAAAGGALVLAVLGASADAELLHLDIWKALDGVVPGGVVLQMVGPEVDEERHLQTVNITSGVRAVFYKGEYSSLADEVAASGGALPSLPALSALDDPASVESKVKPTSKPESKDDSEVVACEPATQVESKVPAGGSKVQSCLPQELRALPHVLAGFNLGLTCPDYKWGKTLKAIHRVFDERCDAIKDQPGKGSVVVRLPWLQTSNTEVEALMEEEVVVRAGWSTATVLRRNPWGSLEPLQSGTLANDIYRKSAWCATYELMRRVARGGGAQGSLKQRLGGWAKALGKRVAGATGALIGKRQRQP